MASTGLKYAEGQTTGEPTLEEMFADPIIQLIMQRDGINAKQMRGTINERLPLYRATPVEVRA